LGASTLLTSGECPDPIPKTPKKIHPQPPKHTKKSKPNPQNRTETPRPNPGRARDTETPEPNTLSIRALPNTLSPPPFRLRDLRSALAIIPQDPVIFSGKLSFNLDPFGHHTEAELHSALAAAQLGGIGGLDKVVSEGGENFSMGERQLIALARVLLRKPRVLMLDEATASVDNDTDAMINKTIKERLLSSGETSMLVIAHRISTVIDSSKVLVLDHGHVQEFDTPTALLTDRKSSLSSMVDKMGVSAAATLRAQCGAA